MKNIVLFFLKTYKIFISPALVVLFGKACRFKPSCSEYAFEVIEKHGLVKGGKLAALRLLKCNSLFTKGYSVT